MPDPTSKVVHYTFPLKKHKRAKVRAVDFHLHRAVHAGDVEAVKLALSQGADPNAWYNLDRDDTTSHEASPNPHNDKAIWDGLFSPPLFHALLKFDSNAARAKELCNVLLEAGADMNARDMKEIASHGLRWQGKSYSDQKTCKSNARELCARTLLHFAAELWNYEAVTYLLEKGMDPTLRDYQNSTVLSLCEGDGFSREESTAVKKAAEKAEKRQVIRETLQEYLDTKPWYKKVWDWLVTLFGDQPWLSAQKSTLTQDYIDKLTPGAEKSTVEPTELLAEIQNQHTGLVKSYKRKKGDEEGVNYQQDGQLGQALEKIAPKIKNNN